MTTIWELGGLTWRELGRRVLRRVQKGDIFTRAAALSYYFLLALFPLLLFLITMLGYFTGTGVLLRARLLNYLGTVAPHSALVLIQATIDEVAANRGGAKLSLGLLGSVWFASNGVAAVCDTLNTAYGVRESRAWWRVRLLAVGLTLALAVLIIAALAVVLYGGEIGETLAERVGEASPFTVAWTIAQWPIVLASVLLAFALIYYFAPDVRDQRWYWITPGSLVGVGIWLLVSFGFRAYLHFFDTYSVTYGSLGAVISLMLWFYLSGAAILVGGQVNAEIENAAAEAGAPGAKLHGEKRPDQ